jgi:uncharacterized membrane protein
VSASNYFSQEEKDAIVKAVKSAELNTSGEVRVHIESSCKGDVLDRAASVFEKLEMHKTELRNGVLFYLAMKSQKFAVLGDVGINVKVPENFWNEIKADMATAFGSGDFSGGLSKGIDAAGAQLKTFFPYQEDDVNELNDDISFG